MRLIKTSEKLWLGDVDTSGDSKDNCEYTVSNAKEYNQGYILLDDNDHPLFEPNAFLIDLLVTNGQKDISQAAKALLSFYRYLAANNLDWRETHRLQGDRPIFKYRSKLIQLKEKGVYKPKLAAGYLSHIRAFYKFNFKHKYIEHLPFDITGSTTYGKDITNCYIRVRNKEKRLRPLSEHHLKLVYECWNVVPVEVRIGILMSQFIGLREVEVGTMRKRLFVVPKGFECRNVPDVPIGPQSNVHTKGMVDRNVTIPVWLIKLVNQYHESIRYKERQEMYYEMYGNTDFPALLTAEGDIYTTDTLTSMWSKITREVRAFDPFYRHKWHDNRATFGCAKMEGLMKKLTRTQALAALRAEMGHTHKSTTELYLEHWEDDPEHQIVADVMGNFVETVLQNIGLN